MGQEKEHGAWRVPCLDVVRQNGLGMKDRFAVHDYLDFAALDHRLDPMVFTFLEKVNVFLLEAALSEKPHVPDLDEPCEAWILVRP
jgi:hypothetical protein